MWWLHCLVWGMITLLSSHFPHLSSHSRTTMSHHISKVITTPQHTYTYQLNAYAEHAHSKQLLNHSSSLTPPPRNTPHKNMKPYHNSLPNSISPKPHNHQRCHYIHIPLTYPRPLTRLLNPTTLSHSVPYPIHTLTLCVEEIWWERVVVWHDVKSLAMRVHQAGRLMITHKEFHMLGYRTM